MAPEPLLVFPDPPPPLLAQTLDLAGYPWKAVANASVATQSEPSDGWAGAVVCADEDPEGAFGICRALRKRDANMTPVLLLIGGVLPFAVVLLYYMDRLSLGPLGGLWYLFQLVMSGDIGIWACVAACLLVGVFGSLVAILVARARKPPAARVEEPEPVNIFGPGGYAGPGALGGTESALRR